MNHSSTGMAEPTTRSDAAEATTHPAVKRVNELGRLLDEAVTVPGTNYKVGIDPVLGVLPVVGDSIATVFSAYILFEAVRLGVDKRTFARMVTYVVVDAVVGSIPVLGTLFDAVWKANAWNADLLEKHVEADASSTH